MARPKNPNGVQAKIEELIESPCPEDFRTLLNHYISKTKLFSNYVVSAKSLSGSAKNAHEFKPGNEADNLICNVLQLHMLFKDTKAVEGIIDGTIEDIELGNLLEKSEQELRRRFDAYAYWMYRLSSLKKTLKRREANFTQDRLDDVLDVDGDDIYGSTREPFILRAVQNLERLEDCGRLISPTADALAEKATAMLSLGFYDQAEEYSIEAIALDKACSQAWFVRTVVALEGRSKAGKEYFSANLRSQEAPGLSAEERWAEERMDDAISKAETYQTKLRQILPQAIIYWPKEEGATGRYLHPERRMVVRDHFVDLMFRAVKPINLHSRVPFIQGYECNGLAEEYAYSKKDFPINLGDAEPVADFEIVEGDEKKALDIVFSERNKSRNSWQQFYDYRDDLTPLKEFKLLHLMYVTGYSQYQDHLNEFFEKCSMGLPSRFGSLLAFDPWVNELYTTHLVRYCGVEKAAAAISDWRLEFDSEVNGQGADIQANRLRALFHYHFVRGQFSQCIQVADQALRIPPSNFFGRGVQDHSCENGTRTLDQPFWIYLKVRAAVEAFKSDASPEQAVLDALLSVEKPKVFFEKEESYCIAEEFADDAAIYYAPPYGESLLETTEWVDCLTQALANNLLSDEKIRQAKAIVGNLS